MNLTKSKEAKMKGVKVVILSRQPPFQETQKEFHELLNPLMHEL